MGQGNAFFLVFAVLSLIAFRVPLMTLAQLSFRNEHYSHILLIPLTSLGLIYMDRKRVFRHSGYGFRAGTALLLIGLILYWFGQASSRLFGDMDSLSLTILGIVVFWMGGVIFSYGLEAFRGAAFSFLFLLLMVPLPTFLLDGAIRALQIGSAEAVSLLFGISGVPVFREGLFFSLPGITIAIAKECSGIRSSLALFIISLLAGHLFLLSTWKKVFLMLLIIPVLILKNALRIVTLSLLGIYVDESFLVGRLHQYGGVLFFLMALVILAAVLRMLERSEAESPKLWSRICAQATSIARPTVRGEVRLRS